MENQELIKQVTEKAEKWLTPAYDAETQAEDMVGHKLGEFAPTRTYKGHAGSKTSK